MRRLRSSVADVTMITNWFASSRAYSDKHTADLYVVYGNEIPPDNLDGWQRERDRRRRRADVEGTVRSTGLAAAISKIATSRSSTSTKTRVRDAKPNVPRR